MLEFRRLTMKTYEEGYNDGYNTYMKMLYEKKKHGNTMGEGDTGKEYLNGFRDGWNDAKNAMTP